MEKKATFFLHGTDYASIRQQAGRNEPGFLSLFLPAVAFLRETLTGEREKRRTIYASLL
jgi:hypothetical protein